VQDDLVNPVAADVTLALGNNPSGAVLLGTTTQATVAGVATFPDLQLRTEGMGYTLTAAVGSLPMPTSLPFDVTPGAGAHLVFSSEPATVQAGTKFSPPISVTVEDQLGNVIASTGTITVALGAHPAGATLLGTTTIAAVDGTATFEDLALPTAGTGYTLSATSAAYGTATSTTFAIQPGSATQLAFVQQPGDIYQGSPFSPAVSVRVLDAFGNLATSSTASISLAAAPGEAATLSGTATVGVVGGTATFAGVSVLTAGTFELAASSGSLSAATSDSFQVFADNWTIATTATPTINSLWGSGANDIWGVGLNHASGVAVHWDGTAWTTVTTGMTELYAVWGSGPDDVWASGDEGVIHWNGSVWSSVASFQNPPRGLWGSSPDDVWGVSSDSIIHWNGSSWSTSSSDTVNFDTVWGSGPDDVWAGGADEADDVGLLDHWDGTSWSRVSTPAIGAVSSVWGTGPDDVWAIGIGVIHWDGTAWSTIPGGSAIDSIGLWGSSATDVWTVGGYTAAGTTAGILHWDGSSWVNVPGGTNANLLSVWGSSANDVWAAGEGVILHWSSP
jgi:hypothetical protein